LQGPISRRRTIQISIFFQEIARTIDVEVVNSWIHHTERYLLDPPEPSMSINATKSVNGSIYEDTLSVTLGAGVDDYKIRISPSDSGDWDGAPTGQRDIEDITSASQTLYTFRSPMP